LLVAYSDTVLSFNVKLSHIRTFLLE